MTPDEWKRRYAARMMLMTDAPERAAIEAAEAGFEYATEAWGKFSAEWEGPENAADEEMSYWEDDGD